VDWLADYQLVLLDLDGLLVNTEELHYQAYQKMCARRGYVLKLSFRDYCGIAHRSAEGLEQMVYTQFPQLLIEEPRWKVLYAEKKQAYIELLHSGAVQPMPGVEPFLIGLQRLGINRCVVTHSACDLADIIRKQLPILNTIPYWFTRESYEHPKPHPDGYQRAIAGLAKQGDRVIGFEDTPRGLEALRGTSATRVLICAKDYPCFPDAQAGDFLHFESLAQVNNRP
jgi:beta-phosphoglucomutase